MLDFPISSYWILSKFFLIISENLILLEGCFEFVSFLNYAMNIEPRETFDDIPRDYHGLRKCIELCIIAPHFHCKVLLLLFIYWDQTIR